MKKHTKISIFSFAILATLAVPAAQAQTSKAAYVAPTDPGLTASDADVVSYIASKKAALAPYLNSSDETMKRQVAREQNEIERLQKWHQSVVDGQKVGASLDMKTIEDQERAVEHQIEYWEKQNAVAAVTPTPFAPETAEQVTNTNTNTAQSMNATNASVNNAQAATLKSSAKTETVITSQANSCVQPTGPLQQSEKDFAKKMTADTAGPKEMMACLKAVGAMSTNQKTSSYWHKFEGKDTFAIHCSDRDLKKGDGDSQLSFVFLNDTGYKSVTFPIYRVIQQFSWGSEHVNFARNIVQFKSKGKNYYIGNYGKMFDIADDSNFSSYINQHPQFNKTPAKAKSLIIDNYRAANGGQEVDLKDVTAGAASSNATDGSFSEGDAQRCVRQELSEKLKDFVNSNKTPGSPRPAERATFTAFQQQYPACSTAVNYGDFHNSYIYTQ